MFRTIIFIKYIVLCWLLDWTGVTITFVTKGWWTMDRSNKNDFKWCAVRLDRHPFTYVNLFECAYKCIFFLKVCAQCETHRLLLNTWHCRHLFLLCAFHQNKRKPAFLSRSLLAKCYVKSYQRNLSVYFL